jgi:hypothetical protein
MRGSEITHAGDARLSEAGKAVAFLKKAPEKTFDTSGENARRPRRKKFFGSFFQKRTFLASDPHALAIFKH